MSFPLTMSLTAGPGPPVPGPPVPTPQCRVGRSCRRRGGKGPLRLSRGPSAVLTFGQQVALRLPAPGSAQLLYQALRPSSVHPWCVQDTLGGGVLPTRPTGAVSCGERRPPQTGSDSPRGGFTLMLVPAESLMATPSGFLKAAQVVQSCSIYLSVQRSVRSSPSCRPERAPCSGRRV